MKTEEKKRQKYFIWIAILCLLGFCIYYFCIRTNQSGGNINNSLSESTNIIRKSNYIDVREINGMVSKFESLLKTK